LALAAREGFIRQSGDSPPALLYLAIRAARRAVAVNPNDAQAHLILGQSYLQLLGGTCEGAWARRMPELAELRLAQASAALNRAALLQSDLAEAHLELTRLYRRMNYFDLALDHRRRHAQIARQAPPPPGISAEQYREQIAYLQGEVDALTAEVAARAKAYAAESAGKRLSERARIAAVMGLAGKARDMLLESDVAAFGSQGMALELELLLRTGRVREVREWTDPEQIAALGEIDYRWLRARAFAASGDYDLAKAECSQLAAAGQVAGAMTRRDAAAILIGRMVLSEQPEFAGFPLWRDLVRVDSNSRLDGFFRHIQREADLTVLRGLMALEEGVIDEAKEAFRSVLPNDAPSSGSGGFSGRIIAQSCLKWLE
jgi:hypothetical protein